MTRITRFVSLVTLMTATIAAHANTFTGTINMSSNANVSANITDTGITFNNTKTGEVGITNQETTTYGTGDFLPISGDDFVTLPGTILISDLTPYDGNVGGVDQGLTIFTLSQTANNGVVHTFRFQAFSATENVGTVPGYAFFGFLEQSKDDGATFNIVNDSSEFDISNTGRMTGTAFSSTDINPPAATPEPNSLILLGTGLIGTAGAYARKRRLNA